MSKEATNESLRPYLEIHTGTCPQDINWNNKTNNDSKAFLVNTTEIVRFNITPPDSGNLANYTWYVNKINQYNNNSYFDFVTPSFNPNNPSSGIWEIRVEGNYSDGTNVTKEWLVSSLSGEQAPYFIDYFVDQNSSYRSDYRKDPWGRPQPIYTNPTNYITDGYVSNTDIT